MPTFGDFETFGEPLAITEERGHVSTVWRARKAGAAGDPSCAIKFYVPQRRPAPVGGADDPLDNDPAQKFLAGIKQLQQAQREGARGLAPIHDFGFADAGVWYATDFYPRNTLKAWIARRGGVDSAALRQVVQSIVAVCLALKRARGLSHGNLKAANVFLVGKPRPLRRTPLQLTDAYPAAPRQLARLARDDRRVVEDLSPGAIEVQDLRVLGELLLQLVEGRLVTSAYDYNYPVAASTAWANLGGEGERWRALCNRLLDPQLTLEKVNLESLARDYRPSGINWKSPLLLAVAAGVVLLGVGIPVVTGLFSKSGEKEFQASFQAATNAFAASNWVKAQQEINSALLRKPTEALAVEWRAKIDSRLDQDYTAANLAGRAAIIQTNLEEAAKWAKRAMVLKPAGKEAVDLELQISKVSNQLALAQKQQQELLGRETKYATALKAGQAAYDRKDFQVAFDKAGEALSYKTGDSLATKLQNEAEGNLKLGLERETKYATALKAGQAAYDRKEFQAAFDKAGEALSFKTGDSLATKLQNEAEGNMKLGLERETKYATALKAGQAAYDRKDFQAAFDKAGEALSFKTGDSLATKLQNEAEGNMKLGLERETKYATALKAGQAAYDRNDFKTAFDKAGEALSFKTGDSLATKLQNEAEGNMKLGLERETKYATALKAGQAAYDRKDFKAAFDKADEALSFKTGDSPATKLKNEADGQIALAKAAEAKDQKYQSALRAGQAAYDRKDFQAAYDKAGEALSYKTGDSPATKLKNEADGQIALAKAAEAKDQKYQSALRAGQEAYDRKDFKTALDRAVEALSYKTGDSVAIKLKNEADGQITAAKAAEANDQKYQAAVAAGLAALTNKDYDTALKQADQALGIKAGDRAATALKNDAEGQIQRAEREQAYLSATNNFAQGNYVAALQSCAKYTATDPAFEALATLIKKEQAAFQAAKQDPGTDDYSALEKFLNDPAVMKKPPVQNLFEQAGREKAALIELWDLQSKTNWQGVQGKLQSLPAETLLRKKPFDDLKQWAGVQELNGKNARLQKIKAWDAEFEKMLVWFNVLSPTNKRIRDSEARKQDALTNFDARRKPDYKAATLGLEQKFKSVGVINEEDRAILVKKLLRAIEDY